jgi:hypothetical protein
MKKTRKMRGGNMYGFGGALGGTTAGPAWDAKANLPYNSATGRESNVDYGMPQTGGRRRKGKGSRKGKKTRKSRRRTMRGGANMVGSANSGASFGGKGIAGMADYGGYAANVNGRGGPTQGGDGVYSV